MKFNLIPEPRTLLVTNRRGISASAYAGKTSFEIAKLLRDRGEEGFALKFLTVDDYAAVHSAGLPVEFDRGEGYCLAVREASVFIGADSEAARFYALQTLAQLLASGENIPELAVVDWPRLKLRCFNLCYHVVAENLPMLSANMDLAVQLVEEYAHLKMNAVLIEFEGHFPFRKYPQLRNGQCFTDAEMERFRRACRENHITVIPLLQCLGHAYYVLRRPEFASLRELPDTSQQYCPCNPAAQEFVLELAGEMLDFFPDAQYFHMGGDESRRLGLCPDCSAKVAEKGMGALYADYFNGIAEKLAARGVTPMVWGDIMEDHPDILDLIDHSIGVIYWNYDAVDWNRPYVLEQYLDRGLQIFGAPAARFSTHSDYFFLYRKSLRNTAMFAEECARHGLSGIIITDWSKLTPTEAAVIGVVNGAACSWGESIVQKELAARFSALYFGVRMEDIDRAFADAAEIAFRRKDIPDSFWTPPYCHSHVETLTDFLDRFDWSGRYFTLILSHAVSQLESPAAVRLLADGLRRAEDALGIFRQYAGKSIGHGRLYGILALAANSQSLKCRMGLAFDRSVKALKYPIPEDALTRRELAAELRSLDAEWEGLERLTRELLLPGTFPGSLEVAMRLKFDPDARKYMQGFADMLESGKAMQGLLNLKPYEEDMKP